MSRRVPGVLLVALVGGPVAAQDVAALAAQLAHRTRAAAAVDALVEVGQPAAEAVADVLLHGDERARCAAAMVLRRLGPEGASAIPVLAGGLATCRPADAPAIYRAIEDVLPTHPSASQLALICGPTTELLRRATPQQRDAIAAGYLRIRLPRWWLADDGSEDVRDQLRDNTAVVRERIVDGLLHGRRPELDVAALRAWLDEVPPARVCSLGCCVGQPPDDPVLPHDDRFQMKLARRIEELQGAPLDHVHARHDHLLFGNEQDRLRAAAGLAADVEHADVAVVALIEGLDDPSERVVAECVTSLRVLGAAARAARPRLLVLAAGDSPLVAACAQAALRRIPVDRACR